MDLLILALGPPPVASSRTRVFAYLPFLEAAGVRYHLLVWQSDRFVAVTRQRQVPVLEHLRNYLHQLGVLVRLLLRVRSCHTVYVQKVVLPAWVLRWLKAGGRRLVFDFDDALYALAPGQDRGLRGGIRRRRAQRFERMLKASDLVVIENDINRDYAGQYCRQLLTITGPIDTARYQPVTGRRGPVILGWIGSPSTTGYLDFLRPVLQELTRRGHALVLHLIGAAPFDLPGVEVRRSPWTIDTEVRELGTFDVGLMPLTDDPWSRGKGGYKILQYMAMGIPTVASPIGINVDLVLHGTTGFLGSTVDEWLAALEALITDPERRRAIGERARREALEQHSLERHAPTILRALAAGEPRA